MLNKKGQIGPALMVLGALILVISALYSFALFGDSVESQRGGLSDFISEFQFKQKFVVVVLEDMVNEAIEDARGTENFEESFNNSLKQIAERRRSPEISNLFAKIVEEEFELERAGENYLLVVEGVFVKFESGKSVIERNFDFKVEFNEKEIIS